MLYKKFQKQVDSPQVYVRDIWRFIKHTCVGYIVVLYSAQSIKRIEEDKTWMRTKLY